LQEKLTELSANKDFGQILLEAIDEALSSLGEDVKTSIYFHLEEKFAIKKHEIPQRTEDFSDALERIFAPGARHLEILFMKSLHSKIGVVCKWATSESVVAEMTFHEYVCLMRRNFEGKNQEMGILINEEEKQRCNSK
jgi:hypothetical protein